MFGDIGIYQAREGMALTTRMSDTEANLEKLKQLLDARDITSRLKFFGDLTDVQRRTILVELADLPEDIHKLDHSLEQIFFERIIKKGLGGELAADIEIASNPQWGK